MQGLLDSLATLCLGHMMSCVLNRNRLCGKDFRITLSVKNLQFKRGFRGICHDRIVPTFLAARYQSPAPLRTSPKTKPDRGYKTGCEPFVRYNSVQVQATKRIT